MAIVWAGKTFKTYVFGVPFTIVSDHKPLQWLLNLKTYQMYSQARRIQLQVVWVQKGKENTNADALSRIQINDLENEFLIVNIENLIR